MNDFDVGDGYANCDSPDQVSENPGQEASIHDTNLYCGSASAQPASLRVPQRELGGR